MPYRHVILISLCCERISVRKASKQPLTGSSCLKKYASIWLISITGTQVVLTIDQSPVVIYLTQVITEVGQKTG